MITKDQAVAATHRDIFYHCTLTNTDGSQLRARVNGKCKTWKRHPEHFSLPMKHGMYTYFYLTPATQHDWATTPPAAIVEGP